MNICHFIGNLVNDPEICESKNGPYTKFRIAVSRVNKDSLFLNCVSFNRSGHLISEFVKKGHKLQVTGTLDSHTTINEAGGKMEKLSIIVHNFTFLEKRSEGATHAY